jgi:hypothetical protein
MPGVVCIVAFADAGWSSLAARRAHNPKVAGSNPAPATKNEKSRPQRGRLFHFRYRDQDLVLRRKQVHPQPQRRGSVAISGKSNRSALRGGRNPAPATDIADSGIQATVICSPSASINSAKKFAPRISWSTPFGQMRMILP